MNAKEYDTAVLQYTNALSLNPATMLDLVGKRSKAHARKGDWEDALRDANEVTLLILFEFCVLMYSGNQAQSVLSIRL